MDLLPPTTHPPEEALGRRHTPARRRRWRDFRSCLRWDFGFTCVFCLLHDSDWYWGAPGEGLGTTTVEHVIPRSFDSESAGDYGNCLYACFRCNTSRRATARESSEGRLLDPTEDAWAKHFVADGDHLRPIAGDADAAYTHRVYDLDDLAKVERRRRRRELWIDVLPALLPQRGALQDLLLQIEKRIEELIESGDPALRTMLEDVAALQIDANLWKLAAAWVPAVPLDAPSSCRCDGPQTLPDWLERQVVKF